MGRLVTWGIFWTISFVESLDWERILPRDFSINIFWSGVNKIMTERILPKLLENSFLKNLSGYNPPNIIIITFKVFSRLRINEILMISLLFFSL
jgi:hypothetical protein